MRRIALAEVEYATSQLVDSRDAQDHDTRVHEARKAIKRLRGLLRIVRDELGAECYRRENDTLRLAAQRLATAREAAAAGEAFESLVSRYASELADVDWEIVREYREVLQARTRAALLDAKVIDETLGWLRLMAARVEAWPLVQDGWPAIRRGVRRVYAQGRAEFVRARRDPSVEHLHQWRKRVKYHWFHVRLLEVSWPGPLGVLRDELKLLSDLLGDDHDLAELSPVLLGRAGDPPVIDAGLGLLLQLVALRREELVSQAFDLGVRVFAERPRRFAARIGAYLERELID